MSQSEEGNDIQDLTVLEVLDEVNIIDSNTPTMQTFLANHIVYNPMLFFAKKFVCHYLFISFYLNMLVMLL